MPCSICGKVGHNKTSCPMNPKSKKGKEIAKKKKELAFNKPKPLGEVYEVRYKERVLGFVAEPPPPPTTTKKIVLSKKPKIRRADIF